MAVEGEKWQVDAQLLLPPPQVMQLPRYLGTTQVIFYFIFHFQRSVCFCQKSATKNRQMPPSSSSAHVCRPSAHRVKPTATSKRPAAICICCYRRGLPSQTSPTKQSLGPKRCNIAAPWDAWRRLLCTGLGPVAQAKPTLAWAMRAGSWDGVNLELPLN